MDNPSGQGKGATVPDEIKGLRAREEIGFC